MLPCIHFHLPDESGLGTCRWAVEEAMADLDATPEDLRRAQAGLEAELRNAHANVAVVKATVASAQVRCAEACMHAAWRPCACMR